MNTSGNTILITGGTSGLVLALQKHSLKKITRLLFAEEEKTGWMK
jgi:short-subunit dehydrogenase involved in D-alanine esterification of teichoic acids